MRIPYPPVSASIAAAVLVSGCAAAAGSHGGVAAAAVMKTRAIDASKHALVFDTLGSLGAQVLVLSHPPDAKIAERDDCLTGSKRIVAFAEPHEIGDAVLEVSVSGRARGSCALTFRTGASSVRVRVTVL